MLQAGRRPGPAAATCRESPPRKSRPCPPPTTPLPMTVARRRRMIKDHYVPRRNQPGQRLLGAQRSQLPPAVHLARRPAAASPRSAGSEVHPARQRAGNPRGPGPAADCARRRARDGLAGWMSSRMIPVARLHRALASSHPMALKPVQPEVERDLAAAGQLVRPPGSTGTSTATTPMDPMNRTERTRLFRVVFGCSWPGRTAGGSCGPQAVPQDRRQPSVHRAERLLPVPVPGQVRAPGWA